MKTQFLAKVVSQNWAINPIRARSVISSLAQRLLPLAERPDEDYAGDPLPKMQILGNIAVIPVYGVLVMDLPAWAKRYDLGLTDVNDIEEEVEQALRDANVTDIWYDSSSPGGWSLAGDKLFDVTERARKKKRVFAYVGDGRDMASAMYGGVAPCNDLYAGEFAMTIGGVGSFWSLMDDTEFWKQLGVTWEVFRSGEYKGLLEDPLNDVQRAWLQAQTDESGARFRRGVLKYRSTIDAADLRGQWFDGIQATRRGFVGGHAKNLQAAIAKAARR